MKKPRLTNQSEPARVKLADHRKRAGKAWSTRDMWQKFYDDAYRFGIPFRRPSSRVGKARNDIDLVFDATAIESCFRAAGKLHADLFPPNFFNLAPGAVAKVSMDANNLASLEQQLQAVSTIVSAIFQTGEFDTASSEMCVDLQVGTAALFPLEGDATTPVRFVCVPIDELAIEVDGFGKVCAIFWRTNLSRRAIKSAYPKGKYDKTFEDAFKEKPDDEIEINQDFVFDPTTGRWNFVVHLASGDAAIWEDEYRTQPMAVPRYHRVPGEPYGRGPLLLALPTIKTLNAAVELMLKSAAIQMLGIYGYRPGGTFNPDTVRLGPGEFWPMQATGGVLGPDVVRMDAGGGKVDVGQLVTQELRVQVQSMLGDDRLPARGATPVSATEIQARLERIQQNYMGAWARIVNEVHPVIVRRVIEILARKQFKGVPDIKIDDLLVRVDVLSPITQAIKAGAHRRWIEFVQLVQALKGNALAADLIVKVDDLLVDMAKDQVPANRILTPTERKRKQAEIAELTAQVMASQQQKTAA